MLHIFSFQGWRGGDVEQSGAVKSAAGRHGHQGPSLTTVAGGYSSEVATRTLPASFHFLQQTKSQKCFLLKLGQEVRSPSSFEEWCNNSQ